MYLNTDSEEIKLDQEIDLKNHADSNQSRLISATIKLFLVTLYNYFLC